MGYIYEVKGYYKIKYDEKEYNWSCKSDPNRTIIIYNDDILTIDSEENGICKVMKHTGLCCYNILIPKEDLEEFKDTVQLGVNL